MLADHFAVGTLLNSVDRNIVMGSGKFRKFIKDSAYKFPSRDDLKSKDSIEFTSATLEKLAREDVVRVTFLSFNNIGDLLAATGNNDGASYQVPDNYMVNSKVISAAINDRKDTIDLHEPVKIVLEHIVPKGAGKPVCAYWDFSGKGQEFRAVWSTKGCWIVHSNDERTVCECDHLTNFAGKFQAEKNERPA